VVNVLQSHAPSGGWRLINYRTVKDLITAEFLHDLYNRHRPEVSSYRFRNTLCIYHGTEFTSYAPIQEWDRLALTLGHRYLKLDPELIDQTDRHLAYDKPRLRRLLERLLTEPLPADGMEVAQLLMHIHYTSLSEIYGINLVQIEHALTWAIRTGLESHYGRAAAEHLMPQLIIADEPTASSLEEHELLRLAHAITCGSLDLDQAVNIYNENFGGLYQAYGAVDGVSPADRLRELCSRPLEERKARLRSLTGRRHALNQQPLRGDHPELVQLGRLAARVGAVRDRNKALMGRVAEQRDRVLQHICVLTGTPREDLSRYLLAETFDLLTDGQYLPAAVLADRWEPMVLQRQERLWQGEAAEHLIAGALGCPQSDGGLTGLSASPGKVIGPVRHVRNRNDASQVEPTDILVAFGTDFDLIEGLRNCAGIVTEEGGMLSHASVIARELAKPCLIGVKGAMSRLMPGEIVELDATAGCLRVLEGTAPVTTCDLSLIPLHLADNATLAGEKAARLAGLLKLGLPVLPGVVVPVGTRPEQLTESLAREVLRTMREQDVRTDMVIVRSSSVLEDQEGQSAAGILASSVAPGEPRLLVHALSRVLHSASGQRAREYFGRAQVGVALLVQPYLKQTLGGVAFSQHPFAGGDSVWIEASRHGAHAVVNGRPERRLEVPGDGCCLETPDDDERAWFRQIAALARRLESEMGFPVDLEWGISDRLYLFQVRPITTLGKDVASK